MSQFEDKATAHHESAHAVAAVLLHVRGPIREVTIVPTNDSEGAVHFITPNLKPRPHDLGDWILQCVVGRWAERKFRGGDNPGGAEGDYERCVDWVVGCKLATNADFKTKFNAPFWISHDTAGQRFVRNEWSRIAKLAQVLLTERTISGARVRQVLGCRAAAHGWIRRARRIILARVRSHGSRLVLPA